MTMIGILDFRSVASERSAERLRRTGEYTINLGDFIQSIAVRSLLERIGVSRDDIVRIDRNALSAYEGPPVRLVLNACFFEHCFPLSRRIEPVFVGFQTSSRDLIRAHVDVFRRHAPIGCRDTATRELFRDEGVDAYVTGCLTMTLPRRDERPAAPKTFFVAGESAGAMPKTLERHAPPRVRAGAVHHFQRAAVATSPLSDEDAERAWRAAQERLDTYRREAGLVVTPLLHAAGPCLAMGIPVVLARKDLRDRFTAIDRLLPVYTPPTFHAIDWDPVCPDLTGLEPCLRSLVARALEGAPPSEGHRRFLTDLYEETVTPTSELAALHAPREERPVFGRLPIVGRLFRS